MYDAICRRAALLLALAMCLSLAPPGEAGAGPLDDAKAAGWIGERVDGYLGVVNPKAPGSVKSMVRNVNAKRRAKYQGIANAKSTSLQQVEMIVGEKLVNRARRGEFVMDASGRWRRR